MVIVFDLDDTLYEELSFVRSGFDAVADYLVPILNLPKNEMIKGLQAELRIQREQVFDRFLLKRGIKSQRLVQCCVRVYRSHEPSLTLFPEATACLARLNQYPIYIVTDGNHLVQRKKVLALKLDKWVRYCFYTHAHGLDHRKPSPYCFEKICHLEQVSPSSVVYIADNPHKDFIGIKPLGFQTIRVLTGPYRHDKVSKVYDADFTILNLDKLNASFIQELLGVKRV